MLSEEEKAVQFVKKRAHESSIKVRRQLWGRETKQMIPCSLCEVVGPVHGHHINYFFPNKIIWLCQICHRQFHQDWKETETFRKNCVDFYVSSEAGTVEPPLPAPPAESISIVSVPYHLSGADFYRGNLQLLIKNHPEYSMRQIAKSFGCSVSNIRWHLSVLEGADLIQKTNAKNKWVIKK